jgi:hypothetical protein
MGLMAVYFAVDDATLESTAELDGDDLVELIEEWEEEEREPRYDLAKYWDMLNFALTGKSFAEIAYGDPLTEAITGARGYDADSVVGSTKAADLPRIVADLEAVDFDALRAGFTLEALAEKGIYPSLGLSTAEEEEELWQEVKAEYQGLLDFYREAAQLHRNVVASIY